MPTTEDRTVQDKPAGSGEPNDPELRELVDRLEQVDLEIESLGNRMNTLVRLLDILNKRVDQLEADRRIG